MIGFGRKMGRGELAGADFDGFGHALDGRDWAMVWGGQPWIKDLPYANAAQQYNFRPGEKGRYVLEFFITPFDHAPDEPSRAIASKLEEDRIIGLSWAVLDYDDPA